MTGVIAAVLVLAVGGGLAWRATRPIRKHVDEHGLPDDVPDL